MYDLRLATLKDLDELALLFDAYRVFYQKPSDIEAARAFLQARIENNESTIFIAKDDNSRQVGFTQLYPLFSSTRLKRLWLLNDLFVLPALRGQGISKRLIERAQEYCRETHACALTLETAQTNDIGNQLYPTMGFVLDTEFNHYCWETT